MSSANGERQSGGFVPTGLLSPSPSISASTSASILPHPRATALKAGGSKESALLNLIEGKLRDISARFERRFEIGNHDEPDSSIPNPGYSNSTAIAKDLDFVVDIIWVSGTPSLQVPFLLNIANSFLDYLEPFPFAQEPTLQLFQKLDHAFSSLLHGEDIQTGEPLPGFETGYKVRMTEKVRLRGLVERTRVFIIELATRSDDGNNSEANFTDFTETEDTDMDEMEINTQTGIRKGHVDLDIARVYQRTLADLSDTIGT